MLGFRVRHVETEWMWMYGSYWYDKKPRESDNNQRERDAYITMYQYMFSDQNKVTLTAKLIPFHFGSQGGKTYYTFTVKK